MITAGINTAGMFTTPCPATPERIKSYYDVGTLGQYLRGKRKHKRKQIKNNSVNDYSN